MEPGPRNLITDVAGLRVGNASDAALKSGVTVLTADAPFVASVHVMGGAPGTRETDLLDPDRTVQEVDALVLSGGSAFGLGAAEGVMAALRAAGRGVAVGPARVPIVPAAIVFDLLNGGRKDWTDSPYPALGRAAFEAAEADFALGTAGAGTGATSATLKGGLGSASCVLASGVTVGALVVANPVGTVTDTAGRFWAAPFEVAGEFGGLGAAGPAPTMPPTKMGPAQSTVIAIVATDARLTKAEARRVAVAAHDGIARAVLPSHTPADGDLVFALSTGATDHPAEALWAIGHAAAVCLSRAIARGVWLAAPAPDDPLPTWTERFGAGRGAAGA
ncbi:P1 family peptidase [Wenxinia marina]|uniref:L-aminopeptidase/D-esterase n=1 Tax=Wenxinia marina DSM 24838 TaxID=1123501 RepID=A0A0D0Q7E9_9RHOB|nr:P1 family peptidase [Wenxinia marina]KIQ68397.1 L-aminopeptidase/D-esterase [Wenxinia marina DSM 24838]GGL72524.1 peptidase T4 [Wenxinia marina]